MARATFTRHRRRLAVVFVVLVAALSFAAFTTVLAQSARLDVPSQAMPGQTIAVNGSGFRAHQSGDLTYNGKVMASFTASTFGSFSESLTIPETAELGTGRISAKTASGDLLATATLTILSSLGSPASSDTAAPSETALPSAPIGAPSGTPGVGSIPAFDHVYVIVFENHEDSSIVNSSSAPFINSLISTYGVSTSFYAATHPSQPNYLALVSGSTQGVTDDGTYEFTGTNLFHQLTMANRTWHAYEQAYPGNCYTGAAGTTVTDGPGLAGYYRRAHNPAVSFADVNNYSSECARITHLAGFDPAAANFELIVPNNMNSMHDGSIADGDRFLETFLPQITDSPAFTNSVVFVTFDEGSSNTHGGGKIATIAIPSDGGRAAWNSSDTYSHYSILRTIEQAWGFPLLGNADSATPVTFTSPGTVVAPVESASPTATPEPSPTSTPEPSPTSTPEPSPTATPEPTPTPTPTPEPSATASPSPSPTASWPPGATASRMDLLTPCSDTPNCYVYVVRGAGGNGSSVADELTSVARFFGVSVDGVNALNPGLTTPLVPGQLLRIPPPTR